MVCFSSMFLGSMPWFKAMISLADTSAQGEPAIEDGMQCFVAVRLRRITVAAKTLWQQVKLLAVNVRSRPM